MDLIQFPKKHLTLISPTLKTMRRLITFLISSCLIGVFTFLLPGKAFAYPFWAQQNYENPREATGKIVCANCHLANMKTQAEVPQSVGADSVFKAVVKVPYKNGIAEIGADGSEVPLQVGALVMLPDGFKLAPQDRWTEDIKEETKGVYFTQYSEDKENIILVGPIPGDQNKEIVFPILSPNPATDSNINFGKYSIHVGGNRGRGQVYPTGEKSNNNLFTANVAGIISSIDDGENGARILQIEDENGDLVKEEIPAGPKIIVNVGDTIEKGSKITIDPNVGGFGQIDTEIVLQSPARVIGLIVFFAGVTLAQIMLVLKKKQVEKVQAVEGV